jgi:hypothetical protein
MSVARWYPLSSAEISALSKDRHPWDWYCDEGWETTEFLTKTPIGNEMFITEHDVAIYDPCCGRGAILDAFAQYEFSVFGSDVAKRGCPQLYWTGKHNFLTNNIGFRCAAENTIVFNPPYSRQNGIQVIGLTEKFCRRALELATHKVCALVPTKWLSSQGRYSLFCQHPPRAIYILSERPSMPPGTMIAAMGDDAFRGGKIDYMWVIWDKKYATPIGGTRIDWIEPREPWMRDADRQSRKAGLRI